MLPSVLVFDGNMNAQRGQILAPLPEETVGVKPAVSIITSLLR